MAPRAEPEAPKRLQIAPSWVAGALSLLAILWQASTLSSRVAENTRRLELLEASDRQRSDTISRIDARTARIEATLEIITRGGVGRQMSAPIPRFDANPSTEAQGQ